MDLAEQLAAMGGLATRAALVTATSRAHVDAALRSGSIVAVAAGRYAVPGVADAPRLAYGLSGVLGLESAALHHGWEVTQVPERPHVLVPRRRRVSAERRTDVHLHWMDVEASQVVDGATDRELTLLHCGRALDFAAALAVWDSALRHEEPPATLRRVARIAAGPGSAQVRRLAEVADGRAANPFESVLRAIALDVPGLAVRPQVRIRTSVSARVDLADEELGIVLEADSFEWHGDRAALRRDCRRYDLMVAAGWRVLRFSWEDVMHDRAFVRRVIADVVATAHADRCSRCPAHA